VVYCVLGGGFKVDELAGGQAPIRSSQGQEPVDERIGLVNGLPDATDEHLELFGCPGGLGHRDVNQGTHGGERGSEFVRGVSDESALAGERKIETIQHVIEGVC